MKKICATFVLLSSFVLLGSAIASEVTYKSEVEKVQVIDNSTLTELKLKENPTAEESLKIADYYYYSNLGKNVNTAYDYYLSASGQGASRAQYMVGMMVAKGEGVDKNITSAIEKLKNVQGDYRGLALVEAGKLTLDRNPTEASRLFLESKLPQGYAYIGKYDKNTEDQDKAIESFNKGIAQKDPVNALELGKIYLTREKFDGQKSLDLISYAANQNNEEAQDLLGDIYFYGNPYVRSDLKKAIIWYKKSADQGNLNAKSKLYQIVQSNSYDNKYELDKYIDDQEFIYIYDDLMKEYSK